MRVFAAKMMVATSPKWHHKGGVKIVKRTNRAKKPWQLDCGVIEGKRVRIAFATRQDAEAELERRQAKLREFGRSSLVLAEDERIRFCAARDRLAAAGTTIEQAVDFFLAHRPQLREPVTLGVLLERCLREKELQNLRPQSLRQLKSSCMSFIAARKHVEAQLVTRDDVKAWILGNGLAPKTQRTYLTDLRTLFNWAKCERYVAANPCDGIAVARADDEEVQIFAPEQCERLLVTAWNYRDRTWDRHGQRWEADGRPFLRVLGYATLAMFLGIRPHEVRRSSRAEIDWEGGTFLVKGKHAKARSRRVVELPANALQWLLLWDAECPGAWIIPPNFERLWEGLRTRAKLMPWPHDVLRHTAASMHLTAFESEARTKSMLGHNKDEETLFRHYRAVRGPDGKPLTRAVAMRFYDIRPKSLLSAKDF